MNDAGSELLISTSDDVPGRRITSVLDVTARWTCLYLQETTLENGRLLAENLEAVA